MIDVYVVRSNNFISEQTFNKATVEKLASMDILKHEADEVIGKITIHYYVRSDADTYKIRSNREEA